MREAPEPTLEESVDESRAALGYDWVADSTSVPVRADRLRLLLDAIGAHVEAFREIRERIGMEDVPIHVAADIEQIICETGGDWPEERS